MEIAQQVPFLLKRTSLILESDVENVLLKSYTPKTEDSTVGQMGGSLGTLQDLLSWIARPPMFTTLRVNTIVTTTQAAKENLEKELKEQCLQRGTSGFSVNVFPHLSDCLVVQNSGPHQPCEQAKLEVIVDLACGMSILRGADVFKQGILGAPPCMQVGSRVAVLADLDGKCLKGLTQVYNGRKLYVGTGVAQISREDLFCVKASSLQSQQRGIGVVLTEPLYQAPSLSHMLPTLVFPQNLPSIVCSHVVNPQPGQMVIDMCAAPGGKTTHLACLMKNQGRLIALDKTEDKINKIMSLSNQMGLTCIEPYAFDARKAVKNDADLHGGPPYPPNSFDAVLLDGPCSALGQRPSVRNRMSASSLASFPKLQRMLLSAAVSLLRPGGVLVYSTCTVLAEENEQQAAWLLQTFPELVLEPQDPHLGGYGISNSSLSDEQSQLVQRFDPSRLEQSLDRNCVVDTIGFFIAKFSKK